VCGETSSKVQISGGGVGKGKKTGDVKRNNKKDRDGCSTKNGAHVGGGGNHDRARATKQESPRLEGPSWGQKGCWWGFKTGRGKTLDQKKAKFAETTKTKDGWAWNFAGW